MDKLSGLKDSDSGYDHPITHGVYSLHHTFQDMTVGTLCRSPHDPFVQLQLLAFHTTDKVSSCINSSFLCAPADLVPVTGCYSLSLDKEVSYNHTGLGVPQDSVAFPSMCSQHHDCCRNKLADIFLSDKRYLERMDSHSLHLLDTDLPDLRKLSSISNKICGHMKFVMDLSVPFYTEDRHNDLVACLQIERYQLRYPLPSYVFINPSV